LTYLNSLEPEGYRKKNRNNTCLDDAKLENMEENVVTAALETILLNASWLFSTSQGESLNGALLNPGNPQESGHDLIHRHN
jgi:hypothetical protein